MRRLEGKVAIITGGSTGIGRACAEALAAEGATIVISGRRTQPLESTAETIRQQGNECLAVQTNVSDWDDVSRLTETVLATYGFIDILINNAAIDGQGYIHEFDIETWDRVMGINLRGPFLMARYLAPHAVEAGRTHHPVPSY